MPRSPFGHGPTNKKAAAAAPSVMNAHPMMAKISHPVNVKGFFMSKASIQ